MADLAFTKIAIGGKTYAIPEVSKTQSGLMTPTLFNKIEELTATGGEPNAIDTVKVNGVALKIAEKAVDILIKESTENGKLNVNDVDVVIHGLAALAYLSKVSANELEDTLKAQINKSTSDLETLNGTGAGSVAKQIDDKITAWASAVTADNETVDTFKELVDWVAKHGVEAGEFTETLNKIEGVLNGIGGSSEPATVMAAIQKAINDLDLEGTYVKQVSGKQLSTNDYSNEDKNKLASIEEGAKKVTCSYDAASLTLSIGGVSEAS